MNSKMPSEHFESVAIIGMAGRFPGASNLREFWRNIRDGVESISSFTKEDLIAAGVFVPTTDAKDCTYCDYLTVCGDAETVTEQSLWKASQACNQALEPLRRLRVIELEGPDVELRGEVQP